MGYEYLIVILAATLAGIGTGLVGLSAATAMVPLMIVLCPTFQGEHGAYMATAIALASDILGSAVTTSVYAKNKNIDLKHGWLLTVCIISMCTTGSIAAYFTHQQVLGGFSLFLCVAIGIRFLVKPDSKDKRESAATAKLTLKAIFVSLFFGLTIGFGTGFFGSGGGMMMLIVFTATFFSLASAKFANKVNAKIVGYVTGGILLVLGLVLIFLNYREQLMTPMFREVLRLSGIYWGYIIACAAVLISLHFMIKIPDYIFRKLLHIVAFTSILPLVLCTEQWLVAVLTEIVFLIVIILALHFFERFPFYSSLLVEKRKHEVITSFVILFGLMTILMAVFWGGFGSEYTYIVVAAIMAWGPGDAMAAIIGRNFGKHKL